MTIVNRHKNPISISSVHFQADFVLVQFTLLLDGRNIRTLLFGRRRERERITSVPYWHVSVLQERYKSNFKFPSKLSRFVPLSPSLSLFLWEREGWRPNEEKYSLCQRLLVVRSKLNILTTPPSLPSQTKYIGSENRRCTTLARSILPPSSPDTPTAPPTTTHPPSRRKM